MAVLRVIALATLALAATSACASRSATPASRSSPGSLGSASAGRESTSSTGKSEPPAPPSSPASGIPTSGRAQSTGEVRGTVLRAPTCPVERIDSPCPPAPASGATVTALSGSLLVAKTTADAAGRFSLRLAPGSYVLTASQAGGFPRSQASAAVTVGARTVAVTLTVDSGIR